MEISIASDTHPAPGTGFMGSEFGEVLRGEPHQLRNPRLLQTVLSYGGLDYCFSRREISLSSKTHDEELASALRPYLQPCCERREERWENPMDDDFGYQFLKEVLKGGGTWKDIDRNAKRMIGISYEALLEFRLIHPRWLSVQTMNRPINGKCYTRHVINEIQKRVYTFVEELADMPLTYDPM